MRNYNIGEAVEKLVERKARNRYSAFCILDDHGFDLNAVFDEAINEYSKRAGVEMPEVEFILTGKKIQSGNFEPSF